jgi:RNA polymerase sigma-70 factor (ECF subfamily)
MNSSGNAAAATQQPQARTAFLPWPRRRPHTVPVEAAAAAVGLAASPVPSTAAVATAVAPPRADPDMLLVRQYLAGDGRAFEALFKKYQTPIFNVVVRMVRGEDAYDITQEVFLKALRNLKSFRGDAKFSTWLYTIARHTCLNHLRHKQVIDEESLEEQQEEHPGNEPVDLGMNVSSIAETRELQRVVDDLLARMPVEGRMLLVLRDFEQLSYDEISSVTGLSIVNVKSKIHRARQLFKKRFAPYMTLLEGRVPEVKPQ